MKRKSPTAEEVADTGVELDLLRRARQAADRTEDDVGPELVDTDDLYNAHANDTVAFDCVFCDAFVPVSVDETTCQECGFTYDVEITIR